MGKTGFFTCHFPLSYSFQEPTDDVKGGLIILDYTPSAVGYSTGVDMGEEEELQYLELCLLNNKQF